MFADKPHTDGSVRKFEEDENHDLRNNFIAALNKFTHCGVANDVEISSSVATEERILGGTDAEDGQWPWMAYLFLKKAGKLDGFVCGGTLINTQWIVTAAHCIQSPNSPEEYAVMLGEHQASTVSGNEREFNVSMTIRHENYSDAFLTDDIALMKLSKPVLFTDYIRPVCIPQQGYPTDATTKQRFNGRPTSDAGKKCVVLGWGQTEQKMKSDVLQQLHVTVFPRLICSAITSQSSSYISAVDTNSSKFCAYGNGGQDTCNGDSGGPLLCSDNGEKRYYLLGITSYGPNPCGQMHMPGVYTEVSKYRDWINEKME